MKFHIQINIKPAGKPSGDIDGTIVTFHGVTVEGWKDPVRPLLEVFNTISSNSTQPRRLQTPPEQLQFLDGR